MLPPPPAAIWVWTRRVRRRSYRGAVLHHRVLHLVALGNATGEEAALANVIVEMFQAPVSVERRGGGGRRGEEQRDGERKEGINNGEIYSSVFSAAAVVKILSVCYLNGKFILQPGDIKIYHRSPPPEEPPTDRSLCSETHPGLRSRRGSFPRRDRLLLLACSCWIRLKQQIASRAAAQPELAAADGEQSP